MNKISSNRINRLVSKFIKDPNNSPKIELTNENSFYIFPFDLVMGYITSTENGTRDNNSANVFDYSTFSRIFTGRENVLAKWQNAYKVWINNTSDNHLNKEYVVGRSFRGYIPQETLQAEFQPSNFSDGFLAEFTNEEFTIHTYEDLNETDLFKLYIIPTLKGVKWLYISNIVKYYTPNKELHHSELTLSSLNNKIAKTGRAEEEYIQRGAAGEGYAWPLISADGTITVDPIRARDVPITSIQIEGAGPMAFGTMYCFGRPTIQNPDGSSAFNPKILASRRLVPYQIETPIKSPFTKPSAESDWYVGKFVPTLEEDFDDFKTLFQARFDPSIRALWEGDFKSVGSLADVRASNPITLGTHNNLMWDSNWKFNVNQTYDTTTSTSTPDQLVINKELTLPELFMINIYGLNPFSSLPMSVAQNITWSLHNIPIIGGILNKLTAGIPFGWTNTSIKVKMSNITVILPASVVEYANKLLPDRTDNKARIDFSTLTDDAAKNDAIEFSGIKATGSLIKTSLTDRFYKTINGKEYIFNFVDEGQNGATGIADDGTTFTYANNIELIIDETCRPAPRDANTPGYVIDVSTSYMVAKLDYRQTFFSNTTQVWSGIYQTNSKFTTSIRDWVNIIKFSDWNTQDGKTLDYPKSVVIPAPPNTNNPIIPIQDFSYALDILNYPPNGDNNVPTLTNIKIIDDVLQSGNYQLPILLERTFDTTKYGGLNAFINDYKDIQLNGVLSQQGPQTGKTYPLEPSKNAVISNIVARFNFTFDLETLRTQGSISHLIHTSYTTNPIVGYSNEPGKFDIFHRIKADKPIKTNYYIRLTTDNNNIKMGWFIEYEWEEQELINLDQDNNYNWRFISLAQLLSLSFDVALAQANPKVRPTTTN